MISENKLKHMLGVARKCYKLALEAGESEDRARSYWLMGFLHDIGYEFTEDGEQHEEIGYQMLYTPGGDSTVKAFVWGHMTRAIREHGNPDIDFNHTNDYLKVLVKADFTTDKEGKECTVEERIKDIGERYGFDSETYAACLRQRENMKIN